MHINACILTLTDFSDFSKTCMVYICVGTEDMRADEGSPHRRRPFSEMPDVFPRMFDDMLPTPSTEDANARVRAPGYRYQPVSRGMPTAILVKWIHKEKNRFY